MLSEWRENAITRGGAEKYYFVICFSVDTSTPELASMESTCFASVTGVAFAECKRTPPYFATVQLRGNRARHASPGRLSAPSSTDISRVSAVAKHRDASLLPPRILSWRHTDKCDGRLRVVLQKEEKTRQGVREKWKEKDRVDVKNKSDGKVGLSVAEV